MRQHNTHTPPTTTECLDASRDCRAFTISLLKLASASARAAASAAALGLGARGLGARGLDARELGARGLDARRATGVGEGRRASGRPYPGPP